MEVHVNKLSTFSIYYESKYASRLGEIIEIDNTIMRALIGKVGDWTLRRDTGEGSGMAGVCVTCVP